MDKLSFNVRCRFVTHLALLVLALLVDCHNTTGKSNISTLFSSNDSFYRITLYRENYILPYHRLQQIIPPEPISVDWIQPIMDDRVAARGNRDLQKGKTFLTSRRMKRKPTMKGLGRRNTVKKSQRKMQRKNSDVKRKRMGLILNPEEIPQMPATPLVGTPITPILRTKRSFQGSYFDTRLTTSPEASQKVFFSSAHSTPRLGTLPEENVMSEVIKTPGSMASFSQSPVEEKYKAIKMHMDTYVRLVSHSKRGNLSKKSSFSKREEAIEKVIHKLVHVVAERPYYDYMVEEEVAFQISLKVPLFYLKNTNTRFYAAYTQQSWWQTKTSISAFFRETNFMPEFFIEQPFLTQPGWRPQIESIKIGGIHQSNGEGLEWERSWNRLFLEVYLKCGPFQLIFEPWWVLSTKDRATYNPDIEEYLGYWRFNIKFNHKFFQFNLQKQKNACQLLASIPLLPALNLTFFYFNGKGSTLSLYKQNNSSWGIGIGTKI